VTLRRLTRPLRHGAAYVALRLLTAGLRRLPIDRALALGERAGVFLSRFAPRDRARTIAQLEHAGLEVDPAACWSDLGRRAVEVALADRMLARVDVEPTGLAQLRAAIESGWGVVVATCHLGNWELMAGALAREGVDVHTLAARRGSGPLHAWLGRIRRRLRVRVHHPGGGARTAARHLKRGGALAVFVDQNTGERGRAVPFFGHAAPTPATYERMQRISAATTLFAWNVRGPDGRYTVRIEAVPATLESVTLRVEARVRAHPTQWVWLHDRWTPAAPAPRPRESARSVPPRLYAGMEPARVAATPRGNATRSAPCPPTAPPLEAAAAQSSGSSRC
jgi:KDO2-lipid IV(A) lauroyltransferase